MSDQEAVQQETDSAPTPSWLKQPASPQGYEHLPDPRISQPQHPAQQAAAPAPRGPKPDEFISEFVERPTEVLNSYVAPLAQQVQALQQQIQQRDAMSLTEAVGQAQTAIEKHYKHFFSKDKAFCSADGKVRNRAEGSMRAYYEQAVRRAAQTGDFTDLRAMEDPRWADMVLYGAKRMEGYPVGGHAGPISGGYVESSRSAPASSRRSSGLDPEVLEQMKAMGVSEEEFLAAQKAHDDWRKR